MADSQVLFQTSTARVMVVHASHTTNISILLFNSIFPLHINLSHTTCFSEKTHQALGDILDLVVLV